MRCSRIKRLISACFDGELSEKDAQVVRAHLAACEACRAFRADLSRIDASLDCITAPDARWGFAERTLTRISAAPEPRMGPRRWLDLFRPVPIGVGLAAFSTGVALTVFSAGQAYTNGATTVMASADGELEAIVGDDYFTKLAEVSVDEQLMALLAEMED